MKKIVRVLTKYIIINLLKIINSSLKYTNYKVYPPLDNLKKIKFDYSKETRRLVIDTKKEQFDKIYVDTSFYNSKLCHLGKKYNSNKSAFNLKGHRSGFTGIYSILFFNLKKKKIKMAEIGIEKNASTQMWRNFFVKAEIHGFENDVGKIKKAKKQKLKNTFYHQLDVSKKNEIIKTFGSVKKKFDIIIDDSTHIFEDQIRIIKNTHKFLNKGGMLIIEDIYKNRKKHDEKNYYYELRKIKKEFQEIIFIESSHINNYTASWQNEKILLFVKK